MRLSFLLSAIILFICVAGIGAEEKNCNSLMGQFDSRPFLEFLKARYLIFSVPETGGEFVLITYNDGNTLKGTLLTYSLELLLQFEKGTLDRYSSQTKLDIVHVKEDNKIIHFASGDRKTALTLSLASPLGRDDLRVNSVSLTSDKMSLKEIIRGQKVRVLEVNIRDPKEYPISVETYSDNDAKEIYQVLKGVKWPLEMTESLFQLVLENEKLINDQWRQEFLKLSFFKRAAIIGLLGKDTVFTTRLVAPGVYVYANPKLDMYIAGVVQTPAALRSSWAMFKELGLNRYHPVFGIPTGYPNFTGREPEVLLNSKK